MISSRPTVAALMPPDEGGGPLLETVAFEQADDRKHDPDDGDDPIVVERLAKGGDDCDRAHAGEQAGRQRRDGGRPASD
jgi:hypothetical protein